jgi:hypothetical protein
MKEIMTIDKLARMSQDQFSRIDERFDSMETKFEARFNKIDNTLKTVLDVVLEIPSKKAFERLENKVNIMDVELASVQRKISK